MDEKGRTNTGEYEELIKEVKANSPYKRLSSAKKKWMSVSEMGELLGLKKTDRYWLVHKNFFEIKEIAGKMRVNIAYGASQRPVLRSKTAEMRS